MSYRFVSVMASLTVAGALSACGGGSSVSSPTDALQAATHAQCNKYFDCMSTYPGGAADFTTTFGASADACYTMSYNTAAAAAYEASVSAGRIDFNADDAQTCLDAFDALTCANLWTLQDAPSPACNTTFVGTVADGGSCTIDEDCSTAGDDCDATSNTCTAG